MNITIKAALTIACLGMPYTQTKASTDDTNNALCKATSIGVVAGTITGLVIYKLTDGKAY